MALQRQQAFQQLRSPCVELSSVALKFKAKQASVKQVLTALRTAQKVIQKLSDENALDEKLAEYAFFPLTHVYNEAQRLSSACLESAVQSTSLLVSNGWRGLLAPAMGKQLLILMSLLAGGDPRKQSELPSDDLKVSAFECTRLLVLQLTISNAANDLFDDLSLKNIVDQLVYILLEAITESSSAYVQESAATALIALTGAISNHVLLASLLPRTVSALTKSLRPSTSARRIRNVLVLNLTLLTATLKSVLSDSLLVTEDLSPLRNTSQTANSEVLDDAWLRATAPQVKNALVQVTRLRTHENGNVRQAVAELCLMVIEECSRSLSDSVPVMVDALVTIAHNAENSDVRYNLKSLVSSRPDVADLLRTKFYEWCQSLPRILQGHDDEPKYSLLGQIACTLEINADILQLHNDLLLQLGKGLSAALIAIDSQTRQRPLLLATNNYSELLDLSTKHSTTGDFEPVLLTQPNEKQLLTKIADLLQLLASNGFGNKLAYEFVTHLPEFGLDEQLVPMWIALCCMKYQIQHAYDFDSMIDHDNITSDITQSNPYVISNLYSNVLPVLLQADFEEESNDWRIKALALECVIMQADQLGRDYRPELLDTLYPTVSLLGSGNPQLQSHAVTALNKLAAACRYGSVGQMVIENVDYLINSVAMKLNAFDVSPQAPQVLLMMIKLCGPRIIPFLDDTIASIFSALDTFHGYPDLVELLFQVLRAVVHESKTETLLTITNSMVAPTHLKATILSSNLEDILSDLRQRKVRKRAHDAGHELIGQVPRQPWTLNAETASEKTDPEEGGGVEDDNEMNASKASDKEDPKSLSKPHQLLLSIAQAATFHLTSPSPKVRLTLLEMLDEVSLLLSRDENSFLPLVNSIWPAIVPRLSQQSREESGSETAYNICAAADTIAALCKGAGSFMSSRIEQVLPQVEKLFYLTKSRVKFPQVQFKPVAQQISGSDVPLFAVQSFPGRSADSQILGALTRLLCTILAYVRVSDDNGDKISVMITPFSGLPGMNDVQGAVVAYNSDALWLRQQVSSHAKNIELKSHDTEILMV